MKRIGCIIAALTLLLTLPACRAGGESSPTLRIGVAPVSYTHLTLPTRSAV